MRYEELERGDFADIVAAPIASVFCYCCYY